MSTYLGASEAWELVCEYGIEELPSVGQRVELCEEQEPVKYFGRDLRGFYVQEVCDAP